MKCILESINYGVKKLKEILTHPLHPQIFFETSQSGFSRSLITVGVRSVNDSDMKHPLSAAIFFINYLL